MIAYQRAAVVFPYIRCTFIEIQTSNRHNRQHELSKKWQEVNLKIYHIYIYIYSHIYIIYLFCRMFSSQIKTNHANYFWERQEKFTGKNLPLVISNEDCKGIQWRAHSKGVRTQTQNKSWRLFFSVTTISTLMVILLQNVASGFITCYSLFSSNQNMTITYGYSYGLSCSTSIS